MPTVHTRPIAPHGKQRNVISVDADTGEALDGVLYLARPKRRYFDEDYLVMFQDALTAIAMEPDLGRDDHRVLLYLVGTVGMGNNWRSINQNDIAKALGIHRPNVTRSIGVLVKKDIVQRGARIGRGHLYMLNPRFGWRAAAPLHEAAKKKAPLLKLVHDRDRPKKSADEPLTTEQVLIESGAPKLIDV